jgi:hypothetical protein
MALAILATILLGFAPTFYLRGAIPGPPQMLPLTPLVLLHGLLFSSWVLLFTTQTLLVNGNRTDVHRRLGRIGMVLLPAMIIVAAVTALEGVARKSGPPIVPPLSWLAVPLFDIPVFGALIGAALYFRSKPQVHKRLMLVAMIALLPPAIGRTPIMALWPSPVLFFGISDLFLVPLFAWDLKTTGRIQPVTLTASLVVIGSQLLRIGIWTTPGWLAFAAWASGLVT